MILFSIVKLLHLRTLDFKATKSKLKSVRQLSVKRSRVGLFGSHTRQSHKCIELLRKNNLEKWQESFWSTHTFIVNDNDVFSE